MVSSWAVATFLRRSSRRSGIELVLYVRVMDLVPVEEEGWFWGFFFCFFALFFWGTASLFWQTRQCAEPQKIYKKYK